MKIKHCLNDIPCVTFFNVLQALQRAKLYINQFNFVHLLLIL